MVVWYHAVISWWVPEEGVVDREDQYGPYDEGQDVVQNDVMNQEPVVKAVPYALN